MKTDASATTWLARLFVFVTALDPLSAQTVSQAAPSASAEQVRQLSPFEVKEDKRGYYGTTTMSGTRLNSKIEDLAASITVVTKEQMADFAMLDLNDIFNYEAGTEGTGNYSDMSVAAGNPHLLDNVRSDPNNANRIRGVGPANISFGNFESNGRVPVDPINIDAVEISRGPNSSIFGIGNAGGTVNLQPSSAKLDRDRSEVAMRTDSYGGYRGSIDLNRVLKKGVLAIRGSAVTQHDGFVRRPSGVDSLRLNGMVTYKPFARTTVRASYLSYSQEGTRPNYTPIRETVSYWRSQGSPTWDPIAQEIHVNGQVVRTNPSLSRVPGAAATPDYSSVWIDKGGIQYWTVNRVSADGTPSGIRLPNNTLPPDAGRVQFMRTISQNVTTGQPLFDGPPPGSDKSIYDWSKINPFAPASFANDTATTFVQLEQVFFATGRQSLSSQVSFFREYSKRDTRNIIGHPAGGQVSNFLQVDVNERLLDGTANPYILRPFINAIHPPSIIQTPNKRNNYRGQLAYELDLRREKGLFRWLGLHRAVGYYEYKTVEDSILSWFNGINSPHSWLPYGPMVGGTSQTNGRVEFRYYVGDNVDQNVDYAPTSFKNGLHTFNWRNNLTGQWVKEATVLGENATIESGNSGSRSILKARGVTVQSFFLNDRVITTFGARKDQTYQMSRPNRLPLTIDGRSLDYSGHDVWPNPWDVNEGPTRTAGIVVKPIRWLSLHANKSDNFVPAGVARDVNGRLLGNPTGKGEDYGFTLKLFGDKLVLKANQYTTTVAGSRTAGLANGLMDTELDQNSPTSNTPWTLGTQSRLWLTAAAQANGTTLTPDQLSEQMRTVGGYSEEWWSVFKNYRSGDVFNPFSVQDTNDRVAKGKEIELNYNPTNFWTLKLNVTEQESITQNLSGLIEARIRERLPIWESIVDPRTGTKWYTTRYDYFDGRVGRTPQSWVQERLIAPLALARATEGKSSPQVRKYRANLSTSYRLAGLTEQRFLKRMNVGGSVRWEDKGSIGYYGSQTLPAQITALDPNRPIWAKANYYVDLFASYRTRLYKDKIGATFQVNVRNLQESGSRLNVVKAYPDGSPNVFRIVDPRQFIFTATFEL